jgi:hypothetical protein
VAQRLETNKAASELGVELSYVTVLNREYADAFARIAATRPDSLFVTPTTFFVRDRKPIIDSIWRGDTVCRRFYEWPGPSRFKKEGSCRTDRAACRARTGLLLRAERVVE